MNATHLLAVAGPLAFVAVGLSEGDLMPQPEPVYYVRYSAQEIEAIWSADESRARLFYELCADFFARSQIKRVQAEKNIQGVCE
jgi:hypothetical protein